LQDLMFRQFNLPHPFYAVALRGAPWCKVEIRFATAPPSTGSSQPSRSTGSSSTQPGGRGTSTPCPTGMLSK
jgi:hypothetical protein